MYAKGQLIDNASIAFPMFALLALHHAAGSEYFRQGAINAARLAATWVYLWDIPLPEGSTLARFGLRTTGMGACDTPGAGYIHPWEIREVPEFLELAAMSGHPELARVAQLVWHGCNQTVAVPGKPGGIATQDSRKRAT
jgi:hypothetical protein